MKQFVAIILSVLYLTTSAGAVIHEHYCMGKLVALGLSDQTLKDNACTTCGMTKRKGCCDDKHTTIKTDNQYDALQAAVLLIKPAAELPQFTAYDMHQYRLPLALAGDAYSGSPPKIKQPPLYITHCVFLI